MGAERDRVAGFGKLQDGLRQASDWYLWGPYVSERQWGTVREDYSADGGAWDYLPHDAARSRAYRWGEDGLAGFCDVEQRLCLGIALWNGRDPILKERPFGLTGEEANHGEDVKEYWWYLDALPSHAWNRWRYHYPQAAFPYEDLLAENRRRGKFDMEYELLDTGVFNDDRYWITEVWYAKADPTDLLMTVRVTNACPDTDTVHVLPTAWFRNTWSWDADAPKPVLAGAGGSAITAKHPFLGSLELLAGPGPDGTSPVPLFCENETNLARLYGAAPTTPYPKDRIGDHVISGAATVNPDQRGTKCAFWYRLTVAPGETAELRLRLRPAGTAGGKQTRTAEPLGSGFDSVVKQRRAEADEFYDELTPEAAKPDEAMVMRQAFAGMLWSKQMYNYDVARWLDGDPTQPTPPPQRQSGRNSKWRNFDSFDLMSMPDKWEYPWFAAWDLAFHCVTLTHVDPAFAKYQLILLCREWFQNPNGALPASGIDNLAYYRTVPGNPGLYYDTTGCGNSLNAGDPITLQLMMDSLRYWLTEMHADGFRFDLAPTLARQDGAFDKVSAFLDMCSQDPVVCQAKLVAEPWDVGQMDSYDLGRFPPLWREWNGKYRDSMRDFWRSHPVGIGEFADRFAGAADLYATAGRAHRLGQPDHRPRTGRTAPGRLTGA